MSSYLIQLSANMILALVDIDTQYEGDGSPRWSWATMNALCDRKALVAVPSYSQSAKESKASRLQRLYKAKLTKKGQAYLAAARVEYNAAIAILEAPPSKSSSKPKSKGKSTKRAPKKTAPATTPLPVAA